MFLIESNSQTDHELVKAVMEGNVKMAEYCLHKGANINLLSEGSLGKFRGLTLLHLAVECNQKEMTEFLIQKGLDVNKNTEWGYSPLELAVEYDCVDAASVLLENGVKVETKTDDIKHRGRGTALHFAIKCGSYNMIKFLCEKHKELANIPNFEGDTPLHLLSYKVFEPKLLGNLKAVVSLLAKSGADLNAKNVLGDMPLHIAVARDFTTMVEALIENNCEVNALNDDGESPLYLANRYYNSNPKIIEKLIAGGADYKVLDDYRNVAKTPTKEK